MLQILRDYIRDAGAAMTAFLGGVCVLLLTLVRGYFEQYVGWEPPPELTIGGGVLLMVWGQFQAYRKLHKRLPVEPEIDDALELLNHKLRRLQHSEADRRSWELFNLDPTPDYLLQVSFGTRSEIGGQLLVECSRPVFNAGGLWRDATEDEPIYSMDHSHASPERVIILPVRPKMSPGSRFQLQLYVEAETRLRRVLVVRPPAASPATKAPASPTPSSPGSS